MGHVHAVFVKQPRRPAAMRDYMEKSVGPVRDVHEHANRSRSSWLINEQAPALCAHAFVMNCALRVCVCVRMLAVVCVCCFVVCS